MLDICLKCKCHKPFRLPCGWRPSQSDVAGGGQPTLSHALLTWRNESPPFSGHAAPPTTSPPIGGGMNDYFVHTKIQKYQHWCVCSDTGTMSALTDSQPSGLRFSFALCCIVLSNHCQLVAPLEAHSPRLQCHWLDRGALPFFLG